MWVCHKCGKPVYFAERKQSLGYDWHPECLRCEECGKRLNPGQHAEHKGIPYCHVPCYGALFGPQLFGHGTRVESHKNFGQKRVTKSAGNISTNSLDTKVKLYNKFFNNKSMEIRSREVNNRLILEGAIRVYWGVNGVIHLKEDVDQRPVVIVRKRNSCRIGNEDEENPNEADNSDRENDESESGLESTTTSALDGYSTDISMSDSMAFDANIAEDTAAEISSNEDENSPIKFSATLPTKLDSKITEESELDELLKVERNLDSSEKIYHTMPSSQSIASESSTPKISSKESSFESTENDSKSSKYDSIENDKIDSKSSTRYDSIDNISESMSSKQLDTNTFSEATENENTLKPLDFEDYKKNMYLAYSNGSTEMLNNNSLKANQPIDPSRINDSLKLYNNSEMMSKSFNCESALRSINTIYSNEILNGKPTRDDIYSIKPYAVRKSTSASYKNVPLYENVQFDKGIVHSKSDHNCFNFPESEDEPTLRPSTIKKNDYRFLTINMNCYNQSEKSELKNKNIEKNNDCKVNDLSVSDPISLSDEQPYITEDGVQLRKKYKTGSTAIKRRSGNKRSRIKLKRRCSINGHFYNRETSFFTPPYGSQMSVWVTSLVTTLEVVNLLLEKYKVDSLPQNFALFIVKDNGEQRRLKDDEYPLIVQVLLGPHEDVSRIFLMDAKQTQEISNEVAQFINLSIPECQAIIARYAIEQETAVIKIRNKYEEMRRRIIYRMETLKVRL